MSTEKSGLAEFGCHLVRLFEDLGVVEIQRVVHTDDLAVGQFQAVFEHTGEQIQLRLPWCHGRRQSIDSVPNIQQQEHDGGGGIELPTLRVRLVDLLYGTAQQVSIKAQAVAIHLHV